MKDDGFTVDRFDGNALGMHSKGDGARRADAFRGEPVRIRTANGDSPRFGIAPTGMTHAGAANATKQRAVGGGMLRTSTLLSSTCRSAGKRGCSFPHICHDHEQHADRLQGATDMGSGAVVVDTCGVAFSAVTLWGAARIGDRNTVLPVPMQHFINGRIES